MQRNRPPSGQSWKVIQAFAEEPAAWRHGYGLCRQTGLKSGSMYPILMRLADRGWLETDWESEVPAGRPPRHLYRLTKSGLDAAGEFAAAQAQNSRSRAAALRPQEGHAR